MSTQTFETPGLYFTENLADPPTQNDINLSNAVIVGPTSRGPAVLTALSTYPDYTKLYGAFADNTTPSPLDYAVWQYFNNSGRSLQVVRALFGDEVTASVTVENRETGGQVMNNLSNPDKLVSKNAPDSPPRLGEGPKSKAAAAQTDKVDGPGNILGPEGGNGDSGQTDGTGGLPGSGPQDCLVITASNPGVWGNNVFYSISDSKPFGSTAPVERFNLTFTYLGKVEQFPDLSMDPTDDRYVLDIVNSANTGSVYARVALPDPLPDYGNAAASLLLPANTTVPGSVGGTTQGADSATDFTDMTLEQYTAAVATVDNVPNPLGMNLPGVADATIISMAQVYCGNRGDAFLVIDGDNVTATEAVTEKSTYVDTSYSTEYFPPCIFADPASRSQGARIVLPVGGAMLGKYAQTDATRGVFQTAAGPNADYRISGALGLAQTLSSADLALLNTNGINAIRNIPGVGVVPMGARTTKQTKQADRYISVRRTLIYVKAQVGQIMNNYLFDPNTTLTRQRAVNDVTQFLTAFWNAGGLDGDSEGQAFYVVCDESNNSLAQVDNGELHMDIGIAPVKPAEFIAINVTQYDGAVTVTDSAS